MAEFEKRKMAFYRPGMISLVVLPLAFIHYTHIEIKENSLGVIPLYMPSLNFVWEREHQGLYGGYNGHFPPKRSYTNITLTGDYRNDNIKLAFAQIRVREILSQDDSAAGLHFSFSDSAEYWAFVKTVDILRTEGAKTFMPDGSDLWFYHLHDKPKDIKIQYMPGLLFDDNIIIKPKVSWYQKWSRLVGHIWATSWKIIIGFCLFLCSVFVFRRP